jgi:hypothetical protein
LLTDASFKFFAVAGGGRHGRERKKYFNNPSKAGLMNQQRTKSKEKKICQPKPNALSTTVPEPAHHPTLPPAEPRTKTGGRTS